jgi:hypothetical protein
MPSILPGQPFSWSVDKTEDDRWFDKMVPKADAIYTEHLKTIKQKPR